MVVDDGGEQEAESEFFLPGKDKCPGPAAELRRGKGNGLHLREEFADRMIVNSLNLAILEIFLCDSLHQAPPLLGPVTLDGRPANDQQTPDQAEC